MPDNATSEEQPEENEGDRNTPLREGSLMARVNSDPHLEHLTFSFTNRLTALFETVEQAQQAALTLGEAGFPDEKIDLFFGEEGANMLDLAEKHHGVVGRLVRALEYLVTDDALVHSHHDRALREGHAFLAMTATTDQEKKLGGQLLHQAGAHDIYFWGMWTTEQLG